MSTSIKPLCKFMIIFAHTHIYMYLYSNVEVLSHCPQERKKLYICASVYVCVCKLINKLFTWQDFEKQHFFIL